MQRQNEKKTSKIRLFMYMFMGLLYQFFKLFKIFLWSWQWFI